MFTFGTLVDQSIQQSTEGKSGKKAEMAANMALQNWLGPTKSGKTGFRDPGAAARRRR